MTEPQNKISWTAVPFGVASLLMFGLSYHEGRRVRQLKGVHSVSSVSEALGLSKLLPILIAVRGKTGSANPLQTQITCSSAVMTEDTLEKKEELQSRLGESVWSNKTVRHRRNESDWFITDDGTSRLSVKSCANASDLEKTLVTSKRAIWQERKTFKTSRSRRNDQKLSGVWQTEKSLPVDTTVTIVGELANSPKEDEGMVIREPSNLSNAAPFYITTQTFDELRTLYMRTSGTCKWLGIGFGAVSLILTGINLWKDIRSSIQYRRVRKRIDAEKKKKRTEQLRNEMSQQSDVDLDQTHLGKCIVCWNNKVDAVFIPCGHLCACMTCCAKLKKCPICRSACNVHKVYSA